MDPTCLVSTVQAGCGGGGVMVGGFLDIFRTINTNQSWFDATASLIIVTDNVPPFMATGNHLLTATSSRIMIHVTKKESKTGFMNMTVTWDLGCGRTGDRQHGWAADKSTEMM